MSRKVLAFLVCLTWPSLVEAQPYVFYSDTEIASWVGKGKFYNPIVESKSPNGNGFSFIYFKGDHTYLAITTFAHPSILETHPVPPLAWAYDDKGQPIAFLKQIGGPTVEVGKTTFAPQLGTMLQFESSQQYFAVQMANNLEIRRVSKPSAKLYSLPCDGEISNLFLKNNAFYIFYRDPSGDGADISCKVISAVNGKLLRDIKIPQKVKLIYDLSDDGRQVLMARNTLNNTGFVWQNLILNLDDLSVTSMNHDGETGWAFFLAPEDKPTPP